jgi:hypothetical protein
MTRKRTLSILGAAAAAPIMLGAVAGASSNLLSNGNFSNGTSDWSVKQGWPAASIHAQSGHLVVVNESTLDTGTFGAALQCVGGIDDGETYELEAKAYDPSGQQRDGDAVLRIFWYSSPNCTTGVLSAPIGPNSHGKDAWETLLQTSVAPAGAHSAEVLLIASKDKATQGQPLDGTHTVYFDNASFKKHQEPAPDVPNVPEIPGDIEVEVPGPIGQPPVVTPTPAPDAPDPTPPAEQGNESSDEPTTTPVPSTQADDQAPGEQATPAIDTIELLPPDTGNGVAGDESGPARGTTFALLAAAMAAMAAGGAIWRRDAVRNR